MADYRFELVTLTPQELEQTSRLLRIVFPHARHLTPAYLNWRYVDGPDGRAVGCNAWHGDELVGHMVALPFPVGLEGHESAAMYMENGAIHPAHRGRRLQSEISAALFADALAQGYESMVAIGNRYSTGPLLTRFRMLGPLEARIGFGRPARRKVPQMPSFERVWTAESLAWRLANPERSYSVRGSQLIAPSGVPGIGAVLGEVDLPDQGPRPPGPLRVWIGHDPAIDWSRSRFVALPDRLRRSPLNLVFRDLRQSGRMPDPARFRFRAIDFDAW